MQKLYIIQKHEACLCEYIKYRENKNCHGDAMDLTGRLM